MDWVSVSGHFGAFKDSLPDQLGVAEAESKTMAAQLSDPIFLRLIVNRIAASSSAKL